MNWLAMFVNLITGFFKEWDDHKARVAALEAKVDAHDKKLESASSTGT